MKYKLISLDMFYTLADLDACYRPTWERALGRSVTDAELAQLNRILGEGYLPQYHALPALSFRTMYEVFAEGFEHVRRTLGLPLDPSRASHIFCEEHGRVPLYPEVTDALRRLSRRYSLAVASDADCDMVRGLLDRLPVRWAFVSEALGCYKADRDRRFFSELLRTTGCAPEEVLHVGDGSPDILGASASGIDTCLLARNGRAPGALRERARLCVRSFDELDGLLA